MLSAQVTTLGVGRTGRQKCAGDDTHDEGNLDAQLKLRQVLGLCESQISRSVHSWMFFC